MQKNITTDNFFIKKVITISNEYVTTQNKHSISRTHGQSKIKFSNIEFDEIFGSQSKGNILFSKNNMINFLKNLKMRWEYILDLVHNYN